MKGTQVDTVVKATLWYVRWLEGKSAALVSLNHAPSPEALGQLHTVSAPKGRSYLSKKRRMIYPYTVYPVLDRVEKANSLPINVHMNASIPSVVILIVPANGLSLIKAVTSCEVVNA